MNLRSEKAGDESTRDEAVDGLEEGRIQDLPVLDQEDDVFSRDDSGHGCPHFRVEVLLGRVDYHLGTEHLHLMHVGHHSHGMSPSQASSAHEEN